MTYTTIGISYELKKKLAQIKLDKDIETFESVVEFLINQYKEVNNVSADKANA